MLVYLVNCTTVSFGDYRVCCTLCANMKLLFGNWPLHSVTNTKFLGTLGLAVGLGRSLAFAHWKLIILFLSGRLSYGRRQAQRHLGIPLDAQISPALLHPVHPLPLQVQLYHFLKGLVKDRNFHPKSLKFSDSTIKECHAMKHRNHM